MLELVGFVICLLGVLSVGSRVKGLSKRIDELHDKIDVALSELEKIDATQKEIDGQVSELKKDIGWARENLMDVLHFVWRFEKSEEE
ncbi:MAG: hypothetical protein ABJN98_12260 [Roseibium sp.]|uniref:hypothetical protein n=1 Tax=Roseibium polysiphoniae TaxID=2571221 RepID=UPI003296C6A6